jgi:hypothetical protein
LSVILYKLAAAATAEAGVRSSGDVMRRLSPKPDEDVRKGAWTAEEDNKLRAYVEANGTGHWRSVGKKAGRVQCFSFFFFL